MGDTATQLTEEEIRHICLHRCGCCVEKDDGKIQCLNIDCIYGFWSPMDLD